MCHSSKVNFPTSTIRTFEKPSPTLKRRCVSLSAMSDLPTCPVVNAFYPTSDIPTEWEDDVLSIGPINILDNSKGEHVCHICVGDRWDLKSVVSVERRIPDADDAMEKYSGIGSLLKVLKRSSQPAHFIVLVAVALTAYVLNPPRSPALPSSQPSLTWSLTYLGSFSILFGSQMWMTFVSGLVLLFILPRHTFARVQSALFPKYMCLSSVMGLFTLAAFVEHHPGGLWKSSDVTQAACLTFCCLAPLLARLYIVPRLLNHIAAKVALERAAGHGAEAGPRLGNKSLDVLRQCIKYKDVCHSFRLSHMSIAIINMTALGCNVFHLHYLASKLCFS